MRYVLSTIALLSLVACGNPGDQSSADEAAPPAATLDTASTPTPGMPDPAMGSGAMMAQMRQHMMRMQAEHADTGQAAMTMHRMGAQMLAQMEKDVEAMKLAADPHWSALLDSVRQDMAATPGMRAGMRRGQGGGMMAGPMAAQRDRMMRLMELHENRMKQYQTTSR